MVQIPTTTQKELFKSFLDTENNNKIVLSAPFGSGKTTFLKEFFDIDENKNNRAIFVYPVNYSVASNDDIFEFIKYDILSQMLRWDDITDYITDLSKEWSLYRQFVNDPMKIIVPIANAMGKLGGMIGQVASIGKGLFDLKKELDKIAKKNNDRDEIKDFMTEIEAQAGSIYQKDIITIIIQSILKKVSNTVLIIDDLDRIDPEHLFRILNILAAHNDIENEESNKFGFDKIITVFDIDNVKQIFCTKYGAKVDFVGYINKFYSKEVFHFDITWELCDKLFEVFENTTVEYTNNKHEKFRSGYAYKRIMPILIYLIEKKKVSIRDIKKINHAIKVNESYEKKYNKLHEDIRWGASQPYFIAYEFLSKLVGGRMELRNIIDEFKAENYIISLEYQTSLDLTIKEIFADYLNLCLNAKHESNTIQSVKSDLLNREIFYTFRRWHFFHVQGAFDLLPTTKKTQPNGIPMEYQFQPKQIEFNLWEIVSEIVDKIEEKIYS